VEAQAGTAGGGDSRLPHSTVPLVAAQAAARRGDEQETVGIVVGEPLEVAGELVTDHDGRGTVR
jgi:hypothetical protein